MCRSGTRLAGELIALVVGVGVGVGFGVLALGISALVQRLDRIGHLWTELVVFLVARHS